MSGLFRILSKDPTPDQKKYSPSPEVEIAEIRDASSCANSCTACGRCISTIETHPFTKEALQDPRQATLIAKATEE